MIDNKKNWFQQQADLTYNVQHIKDNPKLTQTQINMKRKPEQTKIKMQNIKKYWIINNFTKS